MQTFDPKHAEDPGSWGAARRGSTFESHFWLPAMRRAYGDKLLFTGGRQLTMVHGDLRATPDGLLIEQPRNVLKDLGVPDIGPSQCVVVECKTIDPRIKLAEAKPEHVFQAQIQLGLFRRTTAYRPDVAVISYTNASFFDDIVEFVVAYDDAVFEQGRRRAATIKQSTDPAQLKPEGWIGGGAECKYCPFVTPCTAIRTGHEMPVESDNTVDPVWLVKITDLAKRERQIATRISGDTEIQRNMQHELKELLKQAGLRQVAGHGVRIVWSPVKGRPSYDWPALREAATKLGLDIQRYETVGEPTDRLQITVIT
jgi:CRISPR/Cas system-associated exonuclease Cas4 (RecB family)